MDGRDTCMEQTRCTYDAKSRINSKLEFFGVRPVILPLCYISYLPPSPHPRSLYPNLLCTCFSADTESGKQPSISMSQDCSSLDSSTIGPRGVGDGDSHASLIPGPRSCTVSITSSFDNFNINACDSIATTSSSIAEAMMDDIVDRTSVTNISHHGSTVDKDSLSVLESVGSHEDD